MLDLQLEAVADAVGAILAQQRREWQLEHAAFMAETRAMMADLRRENAELRAELKAAADQQLAGLKDGEAGPQGPPGERGETGPPGPRGIGIAAIVRDGGRLVFELEDERAFDIGDISGPAGEKGAPGSEGPAGRDGRDGLPGVPGVPGTAGERGLDGKDGRDGIDGKDGLGFDDLEILHDGERAFTFRLARDGIEPKSWTYSVPAQIYRGVHKDGAQHERGDTVTWGGSLYHCNQPTMGKPGAGKDWTLAAKRGQDGKDGKPGAKGEAGPAGRPGRDLTQMAPDGTNW